MIELGTGDMKRGAVELKIFHTMFHFFLEQDTKHDRTVFTVSTRTSSWE